MKPSQVIESCIRSISNDRNRNTLILGQPGIGKTSIAKLVAQKMHRKIITTTPAVSDPTDAKGLGFPSPDGTHAIFLPLGQMYELINAVEPVLWFIDDLGQANNSVQASLMPWLLERRCGQHKLPDCVSIIAASNERGHKGGVSGLLEPVKSRFHKIITMEADYKEWRSNYAIPNNVPMDMLAFLDFHGHRAENKMFNNFVPSNDMKNSPIPRTWANAADLINDYFEDYQTTANDFGTEFDDVNSILFEDVSGAVGQASAASLWGFRKIRSQLTHSIDYILENPGTAFIPQSVDAQFAVINALSSSATVDNFGSILKYGERLYNAIPKEIAVSLMNDSVLKNPDLKETNIFVKIVTSTVFASSFDGSRSG